MNFTIKVRDFEAAPNGATVTLGEFEDGTRVDLVLYAGHRRGFYSIEAAGKRKLPHAERREYIRAIPPEAREEARRQLSKMAEAINIHQCREDW